MGTSDFAVSSLMKITQMYDVALVVTQIDKPSGRGLKIIVSPVKQFALEKQLALHQPEDVNSPESFAKIRDANHDLIVVVAYGQILKNEILNIPPKECINLHASLLPKYRGASPIQSAIMNGDETTGVTTMYMNEKMDDGDIILQEEVKIEDRNYGGLSQVLSDAGSNLLVRTIQLIEYGKAVRSKQDSSLATVAFKITKEDMKIDWNNTCLEIRNKVRAFSPTPGCPAEIKEKLVKIYKVEILPTFPLWKRGMEGGFITKDNDGFPVVKAGDGWIKLLELKPEGKRQMSGADFMRGFRE